MLMGWIKVHRILLNKPIWLRSTPEQKTILITLLMLANHDETEWEWMGKKFKVMPGQFVTSLYSLKSFCGKGISSQNIRSALKRFEKLEFLTNESTKTGRKITICNWDSYQITKEEHNKEANKEVTKGQQRGNKEVTPNKNNKKEKKVKNDKIKYAEFVYLTEIEFNKLEKVHGQFWTGMMIVKLDNHKGANGKTYKSDYRAILSWVVDSIKLSPDYARYMTKRRQEEAQAKQSGTNLINIPGSERIGRKLDKDIPVTNETPKEVL